MADSSSKPTLDKEYKYFEANQKALARKYPNQWVVIKSNEVVGAFPTQEEAYSQGLEKVGNEPFLIDKATPDDIPREQQVANNVNSRPVSGY